MKRKQRNLRFIRTKNNLRRGIVSFYLIDNVSESTFTSDIKSVKKYEIRAIKALLKNYKLHFYDYPLSSIEYMVGTINDDYAKGLLSIRVAIKLVDYEKRT